MANINKKPSKWKDGSRNGVVGEVELGRGALGSQANAMADDNLPAKFHLHPFIRFAGIHVSVQFGAKTQGGSL